jgi:hypothetical protein
MEASNKRHQCSGCARLDPFTSSADRPFTEGSGMERGNVIDSRGAMRKFAFVVLSFCLPSVVTVVDAAPSSVRACRCGDSGQWVNTPMRYGPHRAAHARARRRPVIARSATNQEAQAPHNEYGGGEIVQHPAGCPARLFCGCGASIEAFGHSVRDLWLVSSWYRFHALRQLQVWPCCGAIMSR